MRQPESLYLKIIYTIGFLLLICCNRKESLNVDKSTNNFNDSLKEYSEKFRPQFHFSPPKKWMNDPNGLVYNKGIYHLFYQHYPDDIVWGPMHWGHAISKDLIHWKHKPIALYPDENGLIFSGSAVVDKNNTSGFGSKENPPLVAIFTYHLMKGEKAGRTDFQTQGIAYSLDNGNSWEKYKDNPVIDNDGIKDFRDPKVFWHKETNQWIMVLVAGDHAKFYKSGNLKNWEYLSDFGQDKGAHGGVWECPDLFKLKVEGTDEEKWVLIISINPGAPNGGSGTQYFIGNFDGKAFTTTHDDIKWLDYGTDNYAGVTYNNVPNGDRVFIGWMSNWDYARNIPTEVWRSAMTLPRKLTLHKERRNYYLRNFPIKAFDKLLEPIIELKELSFNFQHQIENLDLSQTEISFSINNDNMGPFGLSLKSNKNSFYFNFNPSSGKITVNRTKSGSIDFHKKFADKIHELTYTYIEKQIDFRFIIDKSSVEIFIDDGRYVLTEQIFPIENYTTLEFSFKGKTTIKDLNISKIKSIWNEK